MTWEAGMMVGDQVRLARPLGEKPKGILWIADQLDWKKQVVVKFIQGAVPSDDLEALVTLVEQAAEAGQVVHPNLVQTFHHSLSDDGIPYVVMELLAGQSLTERLAQGRLGSKDLGDVLLQVAEGLTAVHEVGQVHTAVEPDNIFLCTSTEGIQIKLLNLGIASARPPKRTSDYVSPEQYLMKPVDRRSDFWSFGVLAYRMLTGECPVSAQQRRQLKWDFTPPSEMWLADVPDEVDQWFERALTKKQEGRFESVAQMAQDFARFLPGLAGSLGDDAQAAVPVGAHKVIEVGTPEPSDEPPPSDPYAVNIDVDE